MALLPVTRQRERGGVRTGESERGGEKHCGLQGGGGAGRRRESSDRGALDARTLGLSARSLPSLAPVTLPPRRTLPPRFTLPLPLLTLPGPLSLSCPPLTLLLPLLSPSHPKPGSALLTLLPDNSQRLLNGPAGSSVPQRSYRK